MKNNTEKPAEKYSHLSLKEREEIAIGIEKGLKQYQIAQKIERNPSTISREIRRNNPKKNASYRANRAQIKAEERKSQSHNKQRIPNKKLRRFIVKHLIEQGYSPEIIAVKAAEKNERWKTNYETIYQWIYNDRQDLIPYLTKSHKKRRKRKSGKQKRSKIPNRVMIEKRPDYINFRSRIGHWEIDTAISRKSKAAIMVLVERKTRYTIIRKLQSKTAVAVHYATVKSFKALPANVRKSITYDNGLENVLHEQTNKVLNIKSYFCNPYHSWEKGTVENIIGIIRRFYPKKTDWKKVSQWDLNKVAHYINNRPMKLLGFKTPYQVFVALAA